MTRRNLLTNAWAQLVLTCLILVGINVWSFHHFQRLDLTEDRIYSLDLKTRALVHRLEKPILVKVYFSDDLCHPHQNHKATVIETLEELQAYSHGLMDIEVINPTGNPELIEQAKRFGIQSKTVDYQCDDREEIRDVFMGISMLHQDRERVIDWVDDLEALEYDLARALKYLVEGEDRKVIGWSIENQELNLFSPKMPKQLWPLRDSLGFCPSTHMGASTEMVEICQKSRDYELGPVILGGTGPIPDVVDLLFIVEPKTTLSDRALYQIDQFIMRGGAVAFFPSNMVPDPRAPKRPRRIYHGLEPLLEHYGVQLNRDILVDRQNYELKTPLIPVVKTLNDSHVTVDQVESLLFPYASTVTLTGIDEERIIATVLAQSEASSGAIREVETLDPKHYELVSPGEERGSHPVLVSLEGQFTSYFAGKEIPMPENDPDATPDDPASMLLESVPTRLVIGGSAAFVYVTPDNQQVTRNLADWMLEDESLIDIRSKTRTPDTFELPEEAQIQRLKRTNLLAGTALLYLVGILIWLIRVRPWAAPPGGGSSRWEQIQSKLKSTLSAAGPTVPKRIVGWSQTVARSLQPRPKTLALLAVALLVSFPFWKNGTLDLGATENAFGDETTTENTSIAASFSDTIPAIDRTNIARIEITKAGERIVLNQDITPEQQELQDLGTWTIVEPFEARADLAGIRALLANFRDASPIDARIDDDNLAQYGLDPNHRIVVEIFTDSDQPELSFQIGYDVEASSGASFIKLSGNDAIYRAYVGGRKRFEKTAGDWRDRVLFGFEGDTVTTLKVIKRDGSGLNIQKNLEAQSWVVVNGPEGMEADQYLIANLMQSLGGLRAGAFLGTDPASFGQPFANVQIELLSGRVIQFEISEEDTNGAAKLRNQSSGEISVVSAVPIRTLMQQPEEFEDLTIFRFDPTQIDTLEYIDGMTRILIQQDMGAAEGVRTWKARIPANYSLELKRTFFMVNELSQLRGNERSALTPEKAGLTTSRHGIKITYQNGGQFSLVIGQQTTDQGGGKAWFAANSAKMKVFVIDDTVLNKLKAGFAR